MSVIAVLGAGKIGEALLSGLLHGGTSAEELVFTERYPERAAELTKRYGVHEVTVADAAKRADVLVVAVKPPELLRKGDIPEARPLTVLPVIVADPVGAG